MEIRGLAVDSPGEQTADLRLYSPIKMVDLNRITLDNYPYLCPSSIFTVSILALKYIGCSLKQCIVLNHVCERYYLRDCSAVGLTISYNNSWTKETI